MKTSDNGIKLITKWEGLELEAYYDSSGVLTIGYGHTNNAPSGNLYPVYENQTISQEIAIKYLKADLEELEIQIRNVLSANISQNQFDALVSFTYNLGIGTLSRSDLLVYTNDYKYQLAANQFDLYVYDSNRNKLQGLVNRRSDEKSLYLSEFEEKPIEYKKNGTFVPDRRLAISNDLTVASKAIDYYEKGSRINYDSYYKSEGYVWISYISYSGERRYVAIGPNDGDTGNVWGKGFFN